MRIPALPVIARDRRGAAAMEAALVLPMLTIALLAVFDIAMGFSAKLKLVQAAARTAELATAPATVGSNYGYLVTEAASASGQPASNVTVATWLECGGTRQALMTDICGAGQQIARYVSITIRGTYRSSFGFGAMFRTPNGVAIRGSATVRLQ